MKIFKGKERDDDLVCVGYFSHSTDAHSLRILLEAHGIQAIVTNEESTYTLGVSIIGPQGPVGIEVHVKRKDYQDAMLIKDEVPAASEQLIPAWTCSCGANVDEGFSLCWSCGADWVPSEEAE